MKALLIEVLILIRLITNEGVFNENRRPIPKRQPTEISRFIRRPAKRGRKKKSNSLLSKLIFIVCCSIISFVGLNFVVCNFMIPNSIISANVLGGLRNPPPLDCKESERRGYETLLAILTTIIALKTRVDDD